MYVKKFIAAFFIVCTTADPVTAGSSKDHYELEAGSCSDPNPGNDPTDKDRLISNAIIHAKSWCNGSGGVKHGHLRSDWDYRDEDGGRWCRVFGTIECHE